MPSKFLIYALVDPRDGHWGYIGRSSSGLKRPRQHGAPANLRAGEVINPDKWAWLTDLSCGGLVYGIEVLEEFPSADCLDEAEREWISAARSQGVALTNGTVGGQSGHNKPHSKEGRRRIAAAKGQKPFVDDLGHLYYTMQEAASELQIRATGIWKVLIGTLRSTHGRVFSYVSETTPDYAVARAKRPRVWTAEQRDALSLRNRTRVHSAQERAECALRARLVFTSEVRSRARIGIAAAAAMRAKPFIDEKGVRYSSLKDASVSLSVDMSHISKVLRGLLMTAKGHTFRYVEVK